MFTNVDFFESNSVSNCVIEGNITFRNVSSIGSSAFSASKFRGPVDFGNVVNISNRAFENCNYLETIINIGNIKRIGSYAFYGCYNLTGNLNFINILSIGSYAFQGCSKVYINTTFPFITNIESYALYDCKNSGNLILYQPDIIFGSSVFKSLINITLFMETDISSMLVSNNIQNINVYYNGSSVSTSRRGSFYQQVKAVYVLCGFKYNTFYRRNVINPCKTNDSIESIAKQEKPYNQEIQDNQQFNFNNHLSRGKYALMFLASWIRS